MTSPRMLRAMAAIDRLYDVEPNDARVIEQYVTELKAECARYRHRARNAEGRSPQQDRGP